MSTQRVSQLIEAGLWLRLSGDHEGAKRLFEQALRLDPDDGRARQLLDATLDSRPPQRQEAAPVAPPQAAPDLIESDWAMATGILDERRRHTPSEPIRSVQPRELPQQRPPAPPPTPEYKVDPNQAWQLPDEPLSGGEGPTGSGAEPQRGFNPDWNEPAPLSELPSGRAAVQPKVPAAKPVVRVAAREETPRQPPARTFSGWDQEVGPGEQLRSGAAGQAMDLVAADAAPAPAAARDVASEVQALLEGARDLLELDDHSGAMELIVKASELSPDDPGVKQLRDRSERTLLAMFESKLGGLERRPRIQMKDDEIIWLNLDHRAGFVLAQIDGSVTLEDVFAVSGMSRLDTARILSQLLEEGVIA